MRSFTRTLVLGTVLGLLALACMPTEPCACPPARTHGVLHGAVTTGGGEPVAGARVEVRRFLDACDGERAELAPFPSATSDSGGEYELHFYSTYGPGESCLTVTAIREHPQGGGEDSTSVSDVWLTMRHEGEEPLRVRVDLVFDDA